MSSHTAKNTHPAKETGAEPAVKKQKTEDYVLYYVRPLLYACCVDVDGKCSGRAYQDVGSLFE